MKKADGGWFKTGAKLVRCGLLLLAAGCAMDGCVLPSASQPPAAAREKADLLYRFGQFVEWPAPAFPDAKSPFILGVYGGNPFSGELEKIARNGNINGHPLVVRRLGPFASLKACHILFINRLQSGRWPEILNEMAGSRALTVSDMDHFIERGGMIGFVSQGGQVRFEVNPAAAQKAGLKMSSQLLMMAKRSEPGR